jgi:hypothetical protein
MNRFAKNKVELGKLVELSRPSLQRYFAMPGHPEPRADGRHDVKAWRAFIQARRSAPNYASNGNGARYELTAREEALIAKTQAEAERARFKLKVEVGEYLPRVDVCHQVESVCLLVRRELNRRLIFELPPRIEMTTAAEMRRPLRRIVDDLSNSLCGQLTDYAVEPGAV